MKPHQGDLSAFIAALGTPYSGFVDGARVGRPLPGPPVSVVVTHSDGTTEYEGALADYCRWDCFNLLRALEEVSTYVFDNVDTARSAELGLAVQTLDVFVSCVVVRSANGTWDISQVCCKHESLFGYRD